MEYTTLFFDLDNTLLDFHMAESDAIKKTLQKFDLPNDDETIKLYSQINLSYWKRFEKGEIPKNAIFEGRFKTLLSVLNAERDVTAISDNYFANLSCGYFKVAGADEILTYLKDKGYKIYATTNGFSQTQYGRIKGSGLSVYFDDVFISENAGHQKPEREYFDYCVNNITEKDRKKILVIGDSQSSDILGGINAGIDTCWFNFEGTEPKYESKYQINKLSELKNIL